MFESIFFFIVGLAIAGLVISPKINDGVILKVGMVLCSLGFMGASMIAAERGGGYLNCMYLIGLGVLVCVLGFLYRCVGPSCKKRRASDWLKLG